MSKKNTKKALFSSVVALILCFSMLVGTTFAWFTDEVESGLNQIVAGNLDVELYHTNTKDNNEKVTTETKLFDEVNPQLWEPGAVAFENLTVTNEGTLALKYQLSINFENATVVNGHSLAEALKVGVVEGGIQGTTRDAVLAEVKTWQPMASFSLSGELAGKVEAEGKTTIDSAVYGIVIYWEPGDNEFDNLFNMNNENKGRVLSIDLGVHLFATQLQAESDSFGPDYDKDAPWTGGVDIDWYLENPEAEEFVIDTAEELAGFAAIVNGTATAPAVTYAADSATTVHDDFTNQTVKLAADVDLRDVAWTPIGRIGTSSTDFTYAFRGTFDGQEFTISNLKVSNEGWAGLFGVAYKATINNVKVEGVTINSNRMAGSIVGQLYGSMDNCHASKVNIMVVPNAVGDSYDNGDKVGGLVGWIGDNNNNRTLTNCSVTDAEIAAYRDVGGIAGYVAYSTTVSNNKVTKTSVTVDQTTNYYGEKDPNAGEIWGRNSVSSSGVGVTAENNTATEVTVQATYLKNGLLLREGTNYDGVTLHLVPADYAYTTVNVPAGVEIIGGYAFAYNKNIEKIVLPSTVTTLNDRAFRDTSASTVVLNEGLTNISYQAFRNASNVKSVVIPSTVTTISKEAFQNSGITTLTIPANVTTIEYGGLRDMKMLESVVIESNADIPVYAFRACTNLRTVILTGNNVTFGGDSRGMIFTNKENGDGSAITVYVANETVKERLLAADTAAKDYGGYTIVVADFVDDSMTLQEQIDAATDGAVIVLTEDYTGDLTVTQKPDVKITIDGAGHKFSGVITVDGKSGTYTTAGLTLKNFNFKANSISADACINLGNGTNATRYTCNVTVDSCTFDVPGAVGVKSYTGGDKNLTITNCTATANAHSLVQAKGIDGVLVKNCEVYSKNGLNFNNSTNVTVSGCTVDVKGYAVRFGESSGGTGAAETYKIENCALKSANDDGDAVVILRGTADNSTLTINNTTLTGDIQIKDTASNATIIIDGTYYVSTAAELAAVVAAGATDIYLLDGEYDVYGCGGKTLTLTGSKNAVIKLYNDGEDGCDYAFGGNGTGVGNITFNGLTIDTTANTGNYKGFAYMKGIFNDCNFVGAYSLNNANDFEFNRCTFDFKNGYFWTWGANSVTFDGCTFIGNSKNILAHGYASTVININNCTFAATEKGYTGAGDNTAAVEIDPAGTNTYTINFTGENTITENYAGWTRVKDGSTGHTITGLN